MLKNNKNFLPPGMTFLSLDSKRSNPDGYTSRDGIIDDSRSQSQGTSRH